MINKPTAFHQSQNLTLDTYFYNPLSWHKQIFIVLSAKPGQPHSQTSSDNYAAYTGVTTPSEHMCTQVFIFIGRGEYYFLKTNKSA